MAKKTIAVPQREKIQKQNPKKELKKDKLPTLENNNGENNNTNVILPPTTPDLKSCVHSFPKMSFTLPNPSDSTGQMTPYERRDKRTITSRGCYNIDELFNME